MGNQRLVSGLLFQLQTFKYSCRENVFFSCVIITSQLFQMFITICVSYSFHPRLGTDIIPPELCRKIYLHNRFNRQVERVEM